MRRLITGLALLVAMAISAPCFAQFKNPDQDKVDKATADQVDQQYNAAVSKTRSNKTTGEAKIDPWSNMRGADATKPKR